MCRFDPGARIACAANPKASRTSRCGSVVEFPTVAADYMYMHEEQGPGAERGMPILVMCDINSGGCGTGMMFARVVTSRGVNSYEVKNTAADLASLGHPELIFKSDNEPSIVALKEAVKLERGERIVMENSPVKESKSNRAIENAIQQVQGQFRAVKDNLEARIGVCVH